MTKEQTQQIKGIAILFMIWGHLFGDSSHVLSAYHSLLFVEELPIVTILSRATGPVSFFLFLSGYGLFCVNLKGDNHRYSRILKLLLTYWVSLSLIIAIGWVLKPNAYDLSVLSLASNLIGLNPTFIPEAWFLLPYILLALLAPWEFRLLHNFRARYFLPISFAVGVFTSFLLSRYGSSYLYNHRSLYAFFCLLHFQFPFLLGMASARKGGPDNLISHLIKKSPHLYLTR